MKRDQEYLLKMGFVLIGVFVVLGIIIGSWVWNLVFDPSAFDVNKWAVDAIFNNALSLAMMVLGFIAINETLKTKENGKYQKRREQFRDMVNGLIESGRIVFFDQFVSWYTEKQVREKKIKHLTKMGMPRMEAEVIVDHAIPSDIPIISGLNPGDKPRGEMGKDIVRKIGDGKEVLIPAIKDTLAAYVDEVLNGVVTVEAETAAYYTTEDKNRDANLESLEMARATDRDRSRSMVSSFVAKILTVIVYVTIISMLVADLNGDATTAEALWNFFKRIFSATAGFLSGGFSGATNVKYLFKWLGDKMRVISEYNKYSDLGEFRPKTYSETYSQRIEEAKKGAIPDNEKEEDQCHKNLQTFSS